MENKSHQPVAFLFTGGGVLRLVDLIQRIETVFPLSWAEEWDNPGLIAGDPSSDVTKISVSLDATALAVARAAESGSNLLITHHPAFIHPQTCITPESPEGATLCEALRRGVALYGIHTNWDVSPEGVNRVLAEKAGVKKPFPLSNGRNGSWGVGAFGDLGSSWSLSGFAVSLLKAWDLSWIRVLGDPGTPVRNVALCGGAGGDTLKDAVGKGADAFVTADLRYHEALSGRFAGLSLLVCDHGEMESASLDRLTEILMSTTGLPAERLPNETTSGFFELREPGSLSRSDS